MKQLKEKLMQKWDIKTDKQFWIIMLVFAITGSACTQAGRFILPLLGVVKGEVSNWIYYPVRIVSVLVFYQILLLIVGAIFGQFEFFWAFEKRMFKRFKRKG